MILALLLRLLIICVSSLEKCLFKFFAQFLNTLLLLSYMSPLYVLALVFLFVFETESCSLTQAGVLWYVLTSLRPLLLGLKQSSCLSVLSSWDHRCMPLRLANFCILNFLKNSFTFSVCCPGWSAVAQSSLIIASASQVQVILLPQPPKQLRLQMCATMPG